METTLEAISFGFLYDDCIDKLHLLRYFLQNVK